MSQCGPNCGCPDGHTLRRKEVADKTDLERCVAQIRKELAAPRNPNNPQGLVVCTLTWHGAIDAVTEILTSEELRRVRFRVAA